MLNLAVHVGEPLDFKELSDAYVPTLHVPTTVSQEIRA